MNTGSGSVIRTTDGRPAPGVDMVEQILSRGYASVRLDPAAADRLAWLHSAANAFFQAGPAHNARYGNEELTNGYRPPGSAHAGEPSKPDANDSFLYWNSDLAGGIPNNAEIRLFLDAFEAYRAVAGEIVHAFMRDGLAARYRDTRTLPFEKASVLQVNSYGDPSDRVLLQERHEDGVLATVIWTSGPGLEAFTDSGSVPLTSDPDEVFVLPGSVLDVMTGGEITPLYHQVRNHGSASVGRKSITYFSCPDVDKGPIRPYVVNDGNRHADINAIIRSSTDMFGLPTDFVVDH